MSSAGDLLFSRGALLLVDKPKGLTSHDVVERVRRTTGVKKIGHTGTLDPMATGLLVLCCGRAARLQGFLTGLPKTYEGTITLGRATTTYDAEGETTSEHAGGIAIGPDALERAAAKFRGTFEQSPPPYSAKKVGGRKFYEMARQGETVPQAPKSVTVSRFDLRLRGEKEIDFTLSCTSGTYIRSIAHELGESLGVGAHLSALRRTRIGDFALADAVPLATFEAAEEDVRVAPPHAIPLAMIPFTFPRMTVASLEAWKIRQGQAIPARLQGAEGDWVSLLSPDGQMLALGQMTPVGTGKIAMIKPRIVLAEESRF
ncbi:MAG TPA: tRNA pseudouridine(55) synthase TruB [Thermoanaerobaculia bacterium]|nr:tRNA pseudouridine(55) synthase TruB [Thermoanaerobaculia bacterium]